MGEPQPFALPIAYGKTDAVKNSGGYLINWEAEVAPKDALSPVTLRGSPGLHTFADTGDYPCIGGVVVDEACYVVTKTGLYRIFPDGGEFQLATFSLSATGCVATNGIHIVATDGLRIWSYTIRGDEQSKYDTSAAYVDYAVELTNEANYYPAYTVTFLDGYLIFDHAGTNQFYNTEAYSLTVLATAYSQAETKPDDVTAVLADHQILGVFGTESTEFHYDAGVGDSPFDRVPGGASEHGLAAPYAAAKTNNNTIVLSNEGVVYAFQGYQPRPISTPPIEDEIKKRDKTTATTYTYIDGGHFYFVLNLDESGDAPAITLVYDLSTNLWHRRRDPAYGRYRPCCVLLAFGKLLAPDFATGKVFEMSTEFYDIDGDPLPADMLTGALPTGGQFVAIDRFELDIDVGFGNEDCEEPVIGLEVSRDAGKTFGNQRYIPLGVMGKYKRKVAWPQLGSSYDPRYRISLSDPVKRSISSVAWITTE